MRIPAACSSSGDDGGDGDARKARVFFEHGRNVAEEGKFEFAIEMFLGGLSLDPDNLEAHQELRKISLVRKAKGGRDLGMFQKMALKRWTTEAKQNMLNAELLLAYDPSNSDAMLQLAQAARAAGFEQTVDWAVRLLKMVPGTKLK